LADEPEFTRMAWRRPKTPAKRRSNSRANRPVVSQKSSDASTSDCSSAASNTRPETGTAVSPGTNARSPNAAA
jgi:hypothetical protein